MWKTPEGDRILTGPEAVPVREAISWLADTIHEESAGFGIQFHSGVSLFDELPWSQRLALLDRVATALLVPRSETPELTAVSESAVGAIFEAVKSMIEVECCFGEETDCRKRVLDACRDCLNDASEPADFLPDSAGDPDRSRWCEAVEMLADRILWDRDYELANTFLDADPDQARLARKILGIEETYFVDAAADIDDDSVKSLLQQLRSLSEIED